MELKNKKHEGSYYQVVSKLGSDLTDKVKT